MSMIQDRIYYNVIWFQLKILSLNKINIKNKKYNIRFKI